MYEFASSSATLLTVYTAVMHTRRMNVIPEADLGTMIGIILTNDICFSTSAGETPKHENRALWMLC